MDWKVKAGLAAAAWIAAGAAGGYGIYRKASAYNDDTSQEIVTHAARFNSQPFTVERAKTLPYGEFSNTQLSDCIYEQLPDDFSIAGYKGDAVQSGDSKTPDYTIDRGNLSYCMNVKAKEIRNDFTPAMLGLSCLFLGAGLAGQSVRRRKLIAQGHDVPPSFYAK